MTKVIPQSQGVKGVADERVESQVGTRKVTKQGELPSISSWLVPFTACVGAVPGVGPYVIYLFVVGSALAGSCVYHVF